MGREIIFVAWMAVILAVVGGTVWGQSREDPPRKLSVVGTWRSPGVAKRLEVRWVNAVAPAPQQASPKSAPDPEADKMPLHAMARRALGRGAVARPAVVFVYDPSFKFRELLTIERSVFGTEELVVAFKFLHAFRLREDARFAAGFWFLTPAGRVVAKLPLNASRKETRKSLDLAFRSHYAGTLEDAIGRYARWLETLEAAEDAVFRERNVANALALARVRKEEAKALDAPRKKKATRPPAPAPRKRQSRSSLPIDRADPASRINPPPSPPGSA